MDVKNPVQGFVEFRKNLSYIAPTFYITLGAVFVEYSCELVEQVVLLGIEACIDS